MHKKERRVKLVQGKQRELMLNVAEKFGSLKNFSEKKKVPYSTVKGYASESSLLPEDLFEYVTGLLCIDKNNLNVKYLDWNWGMKKGGKKGMFSLRKKYPDKMNEWRRKGISKAIKNGTHYGFKTLKKIKIPLFNERLAEFVGVYLGDGTMTKYFIRISGDSRYDLFYFQHLQNLIYELFKLESAIAKDRRPNVNSIYLTIYSKELSSFFERKLDIKPGHKIKNNALIPEEILTNPELSLACLRGLIDTDGSISRRGRNGEQFTIAFDSYNKNLVRQVNEISNKFGLFTFISKNGGQIGTNSREKILNYFKLVGSSNLRHIVRFYERFYNNHTIYQKEVVNYYQKDFYRGLKFPFKIIQDPVG